MAKLPYACPNCERPTPEPRLCETCTALFHDHDAGPVVEALDALVAKQGPKTPYRALREGRRK